MDMSMDYHVRDAMLEEIHTKADQHCDALLTISIWNDLPQESIDIVSFRNRDHLLL